MPAERRRLLPALLAVAAAVVLFVPLTWTAEFHAIEDSARDVQVRAAPAHGSDRVLVVTIDDADYDALFSGRSPLNPDTLARLLRAVARGRPRAIGIDLETSDHSFQPLRALADSIRDHGGARSVWARDAVSCPLARNPDPDSSCAPELLQPGGVLGRDDGGAPSGLVVVALDPGGTIRRYRAVLPTTTGGLVTFPWAVWRAYNPKAPAPFDSSTTRFVSFHPPAADAWHVSARQLLDLEPTAGYQSGAILGDKIVLIGGAYRAGRDEHHTPIGILPGVQIQGQMVETILAGGGATVPSPIRMALLQFVMGSCLALMLARLRPGRALIVVVVAATGLAMVGSLLLTGSATAGLAYFVPLAVLVVIHQLNEQVSRYRGRFIEEAFHHAVGQPVDAPVGNIVAHADALLVDAENRGLSVGRRFGHWLRKRWQVNAPRS